MKLKFIFPCLLLFVCMDSIAAGLPKYDIEKSPDWKTKIPFELRELDFKAKGDLSYILLDWQENQILHESNYRYVLRLNNEEGVQNYSQLSFTFDPSYQKLAINKITIHRGSQAVSHLRRSEIELMRNEENADRWIYDGSWSAVIILKDVRVGDVLEYEYTIKGENPIFSGHTYKYVSQSFSNEVLHNYQRLIVPLSEQLNVKSIQGGQQPVITNSGSTKSLVWDLANRPAIYNDANIPSWYNAFPACEVSSYKGWDEVIKWGKELFPYELTIPQIDAFMRDRKFEPNEKGIIGVIRFVQDEVRYMGIETGRNSHQPHHPEEVFNNRFGDCKDKTYLLTVMLRKLGVDAWPAYVNTTNLGSIEDAAPSPFAFNHVIVKFRRDNIDYWVDPTINLQRGALSNLCLPDYQKALVLGESSKGPETIPVSKLDRVVIRENMWMTDTVSEIKYDVESVYSGNPANSKRSYHLGTSLSEIRENYINFCSGYYNNLKWASDSALQYTDYPEINSFKVKESYVIPDLWKHTATDSVELYASLHLYNMYEFLSYSKDRSRKMPLSIQFPVDVDHSIIIHFPAYKQIGFKPAIDSVVNNACSFYRKTSVDQKMHTYTLNYTYKTKIDFVPVDQQKAYFKDYDRLSDLCGAYIKWGIEKEPNNKVFWPSILISLLFAGLMIWMLGFIYRSDLGIESTRKRALDFGGWLIIPIIGVYFTPMKVVYQVFKTDYFNEVVWDNLLAKNTGQPFLMGSLYYFELLFNVSIVIASIFMIVLMVQKRITFPRFYIWFRIIVLGGILLDTVLSFAMMDVQIDRAELTREIFSVGIWVPYFMMSERVEKTFVNRFRKPGHDLEVKSVPE